MGSGAALAFGDVPAAQCGRKKRRSFALIKSQCQPVGPQQRTSHWAATGVVASCSSEAGLPRSIPIGLRYRQPALLTTPPEPFGKTEDFFASAAQIVYPITGATPETLTRKNQTARLHCIGAFMVVCTFFGVILLTDEHRGCQPSQLGKLDERMHCDGGTREIRLENHA